jgi:2,3-bisphosphoglycerate-independent phosphoglycerate mutase
MGTLLYILLDGVGDRPNPSLNHLSPLEAALTPNLDKLARLGKTGLVQTVGKGISPESDIAVFCMLGYDLTSNYFGRGVVEAIGAGMDFQNGDLALRANFATLDENEIVIDRRAGRNLSQEESEELAESLNSIELSYNAEFEFIPTVAHRAVLKIRSDRNLSSQINNTDPAYARIGGMGIAKEVMNQLIVQKATSLDNSEDSKISAEIVNEFTRKASNILRNHDINRERVKDGKKPANIILLRDAGNILPQIKTIPERFEMKFASILDMPVEKGVAKITGMEDYQAGNIHDYKIKALKTIELLEHYDGVYIHIKGPDEPGHDGDAKRKRNVINQIDYEFFEVLKQYQDNLTIIVSADHSTPCTIKGHSADPVPALICGPNVRKDSTCRFTEKDTAKGDIGTIKGVELLPEAISYL